jgi:hypothetical protein
MCGYQLPCCCVHVRHRLLLHLHVPQTSDIRAESLYRVVVVDSVQSLLKDLIRTHTAGRRVRE